MGNELFGDGMKCFENKETHPAQSNLFSLNKTFIAKAPSISQRVIHALKRKSNDNIRKRTRHTHGERKRERDRAKRGTDGDLLWLCI